MVWANSCRTQTLLFPTESRNNGHFEQARSFLKPTDSWEAGAAALAAPILKHLKSKTEGGGPLFHANEHGGRAVFFADSLIAD